MKNVFTTTRTVALSVLLLAFAGASATPVRPDSDKDTSKCKRRCCKHKDAKEMEKAAVEFNEAMQAVTVQVKTMDPAKLKAGINQTLAAIPVKVVKTNNGFVFAFAPDNTEAKQKIDFNNLDKEMNNVQENMSQMDPALKKDDAKNRKAAEEILKTGIKS